VAWPDGASLIEQPMITVILFALITELVVKEAADK
jgi:hypothetical protein